jgi:hypothetical protein
LIDELGYFVGKLKDMIPSIEQRKATCKELRDAGGDVATLSTLMLAEGRSEYGYDSSEDGWEGLAGELAGQASERRSTHRMRKSRPERPEDGHIDEKSRRRLRQIGNVDEEPRRRLREHDEEARRRRKRSPSRVSERSHRSSHSSSSSYKSSRSTLVEMLDDMKVGGDRRPTSTFR